jgi:hypothetical protein
MVRAIKSICKCVCVCVCVSGLWLRMGYTVMHGIPISSPPILMTSLPYPRTQWYYPSGPPGGLARGGLNENIVSWLWDSVAVARSSTT